MSRKRLSLPGAAQLSVRALPISADDSALGGIDLPLADHPPHAQPFARQVELRRESGCAGRLPVEVGYLPTALLNLLGASGRILFARAGIERRPGQATYPI